LNGADCGWESLVNLAFGVALFSVIPDLKGYFFALMHAPNPDRRAVSKQVLLDARHGVSRIQQHSF